MFGNGDWQRVTTKDTKSTKVDFDDLSSYVFECVIEALRFNNSRLKHGIQRFLL